MNVYDTKASLSIVIALTLWAVVGLLMVAALITMAFDHWRAGVILSQISCVVAPIAAVAHVRIYMVRISTLVRRLHGVEPEHSRVDQHQ